MTLHEPARLVCADRKRREVDGREARCRYPGSPANSRCRRRRRTEARVAGCAPGSSTTQPPHSVLVAVPRRARAPVLHRHQVKREPAWSALSHQSQLDHVVHAVAGEPGLQPQRHEEQRRAARLPRQMLDRLEIEMVVVIVGDHHDIDMRQVSKVECRRHHALGSGEGERRRALGQVRIGQHVDARRAAAETSRARSRSASVRCDWPSARQHRA